MCNGVCCVVCTLQGLGGEAGGSVVRHADSDLRARVIVGSLRVYEGREEEEEESRAVGESLPTVAQPCGCKHAQPVGSRRYRIHW